MPRTPWRVSRGPLLAAPARGEGRPAIESDVHAGAAAKRTVRAQDAPRWPRPLRVIFIVAAAAACWGVPIVLCYRYFLG
jgi:hypothetical protein